MAATKYQLAANLAKSTLASNLSSGGTTISLAPGTGALFPSPGANQYFTLTLKDAATGTFTEIVWCTARTTDTLTVIRAQEGTTARAWLAGDQANNLWTAGSFQNLTQPTDLQQQAPNYALTTGDNTLVATLSVVPAAYVAGLTLRLTKNANPNTTAVTLNVNSLGAKSVVHTDGTALASGDLPGNSTFIVVYDGTKFVLQGLSTAAGISTSQLQQQAGNYAPDTGSANSLVVTLNPVPANLAFLVGVPIRIKKSAAANTGGCTLAVNGLAATVMKYADGSTLKAGDLPANGVFEAVYDGTQFVLQGPTGAAQTDNLAAGAIQQQAGNFAVDTGTANALVVTLSPVPASLASILGSPIRIQKGAAANTSTCTLAVNGLTATAIKYADGTSLKASDLPANGVLEVSYDGTQFILLSVSGSSQVGSLAASAIQLQTGNYAVDSGSANALAVTLSPVPANLAALVGTPIRIKKSGSANTGSCTLAVNGFTATAVKYADGTSLKAGDLPASGAIEVVYDGTQFVLLSVTGATQVGGLAGAAIQAQAGNYALTTGDNTLVATLSPVPGAYAAGLTLRLTKNANANSTAVTLNVNSLGAKNVVHSDGSALAAGDLPANSTFVVVYDGTSFVLQGLSAVAGVTETQLQQQAGNYAVDTGSALNAITITLDPVPTLTELIGAPIRVKKSANSNSGACTLNVNSLGAIEIKYADGASMRSADLYSNSLFTVIYNGTVFVLQSITGTRQIVNLLGDRAITDNGFLRIGSLLLQWGLTLPFSTADGVQTINFNTAYTVKCYGVSLVGINPSGGTALSFDTFPEAVDFSSSTASFTALMQATDGSATNTQKAVAWFAWGD